MLTCCSIDSVHTLPSVAAENNMIIVTGATGQLGRAIANRLLERIPADRIGVSVRDPAKARDLADRGVRVRRGDFTEPSTLATAFAGATQVMLVSGPADPTPHKDAIEAAKTAGAEHIVYTSHMAAAAPSLFAPAQGHAQTERDLQEAGVPFTSLRDGFHATSAMWMLGDALQTGEIRLPADGPVSWTAHADLADAAVIALTDHDDACTASPRPSPGPRHSTSATSPQSRPSSPGAASPEPRSPTTTTWPPCSPMAHPGNTPTCCSPTSSPAAEVSSPPSIRR